MKHHPQRNPYLIFKKTAGDEYEVKNYFTEEAYTMTAEAAGFLARLDGRNDPAKLLPGRGRAERMLSLFRDYDLLAPRRTVRKYGLGSFIFPLAYCFPRQIHRRAASIFNAALMILFIPGLLLGLLVRHLVLPDMFYFYSKSDVVMAFALGLLAALVLHELAHVCAALSYNARVFEVGVGMHYFLPIGYVLIDDSCVSRFRKAQLYFAGVQMNFVLYGAFMVLAAIGVAPAVLYIMGTVNLVTGILNMLPLRGFDGLAVISALAGKEDLLQSAANVIRRRKRYLRRPRGKALIAASSALVAAQIGLPILLVYEVYGIIALIRM